MIRPRAVVFDCDGVLVDSEPHSVAAWLDVLGALGHPGRRSDVEACHGLGFEATRDVLLHAGQLPAAAQLWPMVEEALARSFAEGLQTFSDAVTVLDAVIEEGIRVAVASASPRRRLDLTLRTSGLAARFEVSVAGDEVGAGKPAPDVYLAALEAVGVQPSEAVAVEDSVAGVQSAQVAGMTVVAVCRDPSVRDALRATGARVVRRLEAVHVGL